ncbi:hypothetical protein Pmar_PMAR027036 [Perkinsus marinus ATCC 50983]|uniref:Merozoite surface protein 2 n=2 Tax=Perkinsus marinus TaxID=31276 RepID=C5M1P1_PERM5|nr:hypothetical protein Pmar_PMAR027036 [Perkinsus marinus ATCC 50983]ABU93586.1 putative cell-wall protein [Perkinsus marinus]ABU93587.1 putative cell-wall protein [Perkinsus marinus]EEQ97101.1 hypothetical protein Pmar_PMAR027036 [Perkinsus marinus ATCC 50983]|eukprot:XP_002764384.1 hypothetical protein Pmar_PMAR027036 [Perkinsus marinus ATCC 50983]
MRFIVGLYSCLAVLVLGQSSCPTGDAQCHSESPGSYCKFYQGHNVCQGTDTPCSCTTTPAPPPPTPTGGSCPDGDAFCQKQSGNSGSYCKAAYQTGPGGGVCQGTDIPCKCGGGGSTTMKPTTTKPTTTKPTCPTS